MRKRIQLGKQFQMLDALVQATQMNSGIPGTPVDAQGGLQNVPDSGEAVSVPGGPQLPNPSQSLSSMNPVQTEQGPKATVSIQNQGISPTLLDTSTAQTGSGEKNTVSNSTTVQNQHPGSESGRPPERKGYFTRVPHTLLRGECQFQDPLDFMVYLHLFTYSHGFERRDVSMSQAQLERFTGAAKNTVKRSLERLVKQGWIKLIEDYEHARMSRKWRVYLPEERGGPNGKKIVSDLNSGTDKQRPTLKGNRSNPDTQTVSKSDPYIHRDPKETSENSLSTQSINRVRGHQVPVRELPGNLKEYFAELKPERKRRSELSLFKELCLEYRLSELSESLEWLTENGLPGSGEPCHSPMAFLASGGIRQVALFAKSERLDRELRTSRDQREGLERKQRAEDEANADAEAKKREKAFQVAFPNPVDQERQILSVAKELPGLDPSSLILRSLAITRWWNQKASDSARISA